MILNLLYLECEDYEWECKNCVKIFKHNKITINSNY